MQTVDSIVGGIVGRLEEMNAARDQAITESRQIIRHAANAIRALHRGNHGAATDHLDTARPMVAAMRSNLASYPEVYWAGYVQDAQKEVAEACLVQAMILNLPLPAPAELGVENAPYLNGLAEAASEMRRYVLDIIRHANPEMQEAERILDLMDEVYSLLITVDFPDSITGGLRRTTDALRAVLERTRGDLTLSMRQADLARALHLHAESVTTEGL